MNKSALHDAALQTCSLHTSFLGKKHLVIGFSLSGNALLVLASGDRGSTLPDAVISVNAPRKRLDQTQPRDPHSCFHSRIMNERDSRGPLSSMHPNMAATWVIFPTDASAGTVSTA
jgi:hypothetical protein